MPLAETLLAIALAAPAPWAPPGRGESPAARAERLSWVADGAALASVSQDADGWPWTPRDLGVLALVVTWHESGRWPRRVHAAPWTPDPPRRAACLGQLHVTPWVPLAEWRTLGGLSREATRRCLGATVRVLARHAARCRVGADPAEWQVARILDAYGTGRCRRTPAAWAQARARTWVRWRALDAE